MKHFVAALLLLTAASAFAQDWVAPMQAVHATFTGTHNTYGRWGDSITSTGAFYLGGNPSNVGPEAAPALAWYNSSGEVGLGTYGTGNPAKSGSESSYALLSHDGAGGAQRNIDYWLATDKVEIAVILWGTNDCNKGVTTPEMYQANMTEIVRTCKANGTIPIITTPPPTHANDITPYVNAIWAVAAAEHVPTIDFYGEILSRDPGTSWDGLPLYNANPGAYNNDTYQVPTLISGDGIHPSNPGAYTNNYGSVALSKCGYDLRNYLSTLALYDVYQKAVVATPEPASLSLLALGAVTLLRKHKNR
jgi:lysophospholipase L1-like esterase